MFALGQFHKRLTFWMICKRVRLAQISDVPIVFILFIIAYTLDNLFGAQFGLSQHTIAGWTGFAGIIWLFLMELRDFTINRWNLFPLFHDELILARKKDSYIVAQTSQDLRNGALKGCREKYLVSVKPWRNHPIAFAVGDISCNLSVSLELQKIDAPGIHQWLQFTEKDVVNVINRVSANALPLIGMQNILQSSYPLKKMVEDEVNSKYLGMTGMAMSIGAVKLYRIASTAVQA